MAVIVTQDRKSNLGLTLATMGRIKKSDIDAAIGGRINKGKVILCSDAHVSYKGFAIDNALEHHALKASIKQHVKQGVYHIQHVNPTHNRVRKWLDNRFWGGIHKVPPELSGLVQGKGKAEEQPGHATGICARDNGATGRAGKVQGNRPEV